MDLERINRAIKMVAEEDGVTTEKVCEDINHLIHTTYLNILERGDAKELDTWSRIPKTGDLPSVYEFMDYIMQFLDCLVQNSTEDMDLLQYFYDEMMK